MFTSSFSYPFIRIFSETLKGIFYKVERRKEGESFWFQKSELHKEGLLELWDVDTFLPISHQIMQMKMWFQNLNLFSLSLSLPGCMPLKFRDYMDHELSLENHDIELSCTEHSASD